MTDKAMVEPLNTKASGHDPKLVAALLTLKKKLEAMPEPLRGPFLVEGLAPYASPSLPVVDGGAFTHVAKTKLEGLLADGWQINGYSIHKDDRLGLVTTGAFVGWYTNACEAMSAAESRVLSLEEEVKRLRRESTDRAYMLEAYRSMLGPIALKVVKMWAEKHVKRVHHSWGPEAVNLTGEERAQLLLEWEAAMETAVEIRDIDSHLSQGGDQ